MKREELLKEMKTSIGNKDPIVFFEKMIDIFNLMFDRLEEMEKDLKETRIQSALAIQWEPRVAAAMLTDQIAILRADSDTYFTELTALKKAYAENKVTQNYHDFCQFWEETLGYHPFLEYT
jgi:hypothetical protein